MAAERFEKVSYDHGASPKPPLRPPIAMDVARSLAQAVGKAHGRQMDLGERSAWLKELRRNRSKTIDAPSWLWSSVVELVASHESAYLEHCRRHPLAAAKIIRVPLSSLAIDGHRS
jgi:hypothetical protein